MSFMSCWWWWLGLGALCGWLLSWWLSCRTRRNQPVIERLVDRPIERVVEKLVEKPIDNPTHLARIRTLEGEVASIDGLRSQLKTLQAAPPVVLEKLVDRPVDRLVDNPEHVRRIAALEEELRQLKARNVQLDRTAAKAAGFTVKGMDDLEVVEGIGPKIAELLHADGVHTFMELAAMSAAQIQPTLDKGGANFKLAKPASWPQQARLAAENRWAELRTLQDQLTAGVSKE